MALSPRSKNSSVVYHSIFGYPLDKRELKKWTTPQKIKLPIYKTASPKEKLERKKYSTGKLRIAREAAVVLRRVPSVKMAAVTGSLAMLNAGENSDIDLMIVVSAGNLWTTRIIVALLLALAGFRLRRAGESQEKDRLCLNIWLDEKDLAWTKKNIFTAHEICQIVPLVNKDKTYERFLWENKWVLEYWPEAVKIKRIRTKEGGLNLNIFEPLAYFLQYLYMKPKMTRETVTRSRALFHPVDWSARLEKRLGRD